jgi:hypothetical protein
VLADTPWEVLTEGSSAGKLGSNCEIGHQEYLVDPAAAMVHRRTLETKGTA